MVNFCLDEREKDILRRLIGKKLISYRHDPLDNFDGAVYGRVELFFCDLIVLVEYDYKPYSLFGSEDDDHPKFSIRLISESDAASALQGVKQINVNLNENVKSILLIEDYTEVEWNGMKDSFKTLSAVIFKFEETEIALQGDFMIPLIDIIKGENLINKLEKPGIEFDNDPETRFVSSRLSFELK